LALGCVILFVQGCSFSSFTAAAEADLPVVVQMVTNITNIVAPGVSAAIQAAGGIALASLQIACGSPAIGATKCDPTSLIGQYQAATDTATKTTILQKIQAALAAANAHITDMLNLAKGLSPTIAAAIVTGLGLALQTVTMLLSLIPVGAMMATARGRNLAKTALKTLPSPKQLKASFNAAIGVQFPNAVVR
jgi:hypothetical protein